MNSKKTLVLGASTNPTRYSYMAVTRLKEKGHEVVPVGIKKGSIDGIDIINHQDLIADIHTITLYIGPGRQNLYYNYVLETKPQRVIFNPGTINPDFMDQLEKSGIEVLDACTLVMLSSGLY